MQTYFAKSIVVSKVFWINLAAVALEILQAADVIQIFPPGWGQYRMAAISVINIVLRLYTVRPVAFVAPGQAQAVAVETL